MSTLDAPDQVIAEPQRERDHRISRVGGSRDGKDRAAGDVEVVEPEDLEILVEDAGSGIETHSAGSGRMRVDAALVAVQLPDSELPLDLIPDRLCARKGLLVTFAVALGGGHGER
jgi:hypothetical protein